MHGTYTRTCTCAPSQDKYDISCPSGFNIATSRWKERGIGVIQAWCIAFTLKRNTYTTQVEKAFAAAEDALSLRLLRALLACDSLPRAALRAAAGRCARRLRDAPSVPPEQSEQPVLPARYRALRRARRTLPRRQFLPCSRALA